ncbi:MAG: TonB family protein [Bacteroidota bacterium]|nr:TonB family protein [Bacteroidota bacterium]
MDASSTVFRHWDDVVFENRNKNYGAYLLRRAYADRLLYGLGATILFVGIVLFLQKFNSPKDVREAVPPLVAGCDLTILPPPVVEVKRRRIIQPPRPTNSLNTTVLVTRKEVEEPVEAEVVEPFITGEGSGLGETGAPEGIGTVALPEPEAIAVPAVLDLAEVMPEYEGGLEAMMKFIQKKIRYPRAPRIQGIAGTVYVRFVVNGDGSISDVQVLRSVHPDYDREAVRVISMLPAWKGGSHHGRPVSVRMVLPLKFDLKI